MQVVTRVMKSAEVGNQPSTNRKEKEGRNGQYTHAKGKIRTLEIVKMVEFTQELSDFE